MDVSEDEDTAPEMQEEQEAGASGSKAKPKRAAKSTKRAASPTTPPANKTRKKKRQVTGEDLSLAQAAAVMHVDDSALPPASVTQQPAAGPAINPNPSPHSDLPSQLHEDAMMQDDTGDQIVDLLNALGGQNSPTTNDMIAREALATPPPMDIGPPATHDDIPSSPLSDVPNTQPEVEASTSYPLPHRAAPVPKRPESPVGHSGQLGKLKDGSGGKSKKKSARRK